MLPRVLRVRSMQSELERRNTVGDHVPLSLVALQQFLLVALVVRRHSHSRILVLSGRPCALVVERSETAEQLVALLVRVKARLLDIAQVLAQPGALFECNALPVIGDADALLGVGEAVGQLRSLVLGNLDPRVVRRRRAPATPRARAPPARGVLERLLARLLARRLARRLDHRLELASLEPDPDQFATHRVVRVRHRVREQVVRAVVARLVDRRVLVRHAVYQQKQHAERHGAL